MRLQDIDKELYRSRLKAVSSGFVIIFAVLSVVFGSLLIFLFSDGQGSHFKYNLSGVVLGLVTTLIGFSAIKDKPYFSEMFYVWNLKKALMPIYNKLAKIKEAAFSGDETALLVLKYYHTASKQVYLLDDNTLTIADTEKALADIEAYQAQHQIELDITNFQASMLANY